MTGGIRGDDAKVRVKQRVGAYAVLKRQGAQELELLLTRMSHRTPIEGHWTFPGGGIEHGEDPRDAVIREVYEETGLSVVPGTVLDVYSSHVVERRGRGPEDYHGLYIVYSAELAPESIGVEPQVIELESSTAASAWVPLSRAATLDLLVAARAVVRRLSATDRSTRDVRQWLGDA